MIYDIYDIMYYSYDLKQVMWFNEACKQANINIPMTQEYAIYPKSLYMKVRELDHTKTIDFCFIGAFAFTEGQTFGANNRKWVIDFCKNYFNENSYFINTTAYYNHDTRDNTHDDSWVVLGDYDKTYQPHNHLVPKFLPLEKRNQFDKEYFQRMCASKFTLCPAGDQMWSMRFLEAIMCKSIPIVRTHEETYRSKQEEYLNYKYYLADHIDDIVYRSDWVEHNYNIFINMHTLENL